MRNHDLGFDCVQITLFLNKEAIIHNQDRALHRQSIGGENYIAFTNILKHVSQT